MIAVDRAIDYRLIDFSDAHTLAHSLRQDNRAAIKLTGNEWERGKTIQIRLNNKSGSIQMRG